MAAAAGVAVVAAGTAMELYAQAQQADAINKQAQYEEQVRNQQADELDMRARLNESAMRMAGQQQQGRLLSAAAASGVELRGGVLDVLSNNASNMELQIINMRREAAYQATQIRAGAQNIESQLQDYNRAFGLKQASTTLGGAAKIYSLYDANSGKTEGVHPEPPQPRESIVNPNYGNNWDFSTATNPNLKRSKFLGGR